MRPGAPPTVRQVYALAGEQFPETCADAYETIERLRIENGHPAPRLEDSPRRGRGGRRRRNPKTEAFAALARELRSRDELS